MRPAISAAEFGIPLISRMLKFHADPAGDLDVIAYWTQQSSRAGKKVGKTAAINAGGNVGNTAAIKQTSRYCQQSERSIYNRISTFRVTLSEALIHSAGDHELHAFCESVYRDRGRNQRLRFEAAIAAATVYSKCLDLVSVIQRPRQEFFRGPRGQDHASRLALVSTRVPVIQEQLIGLAKCLVAAAHAAMTGFLHVSGPAEDLCKAISRDSTMSAFRDDHPDSRWLAGVGISWLPTELTDELLATKGREVRALGFQTIASAYRQIVAHRQDPGWQKRYLSLAKQYGEKAASDRPPGGVNDPFLRTFDVLNNPEQFKLLPWKSPNLGITQALEIANACILARRFKEAQVALESVGTSIPDWHLPARSRSVRLQLACRLALKRPVKSLRDEAEALCSLLPHDCHMLGLIEQTKGDLRQIYRQSS